MKFPKLQKALAAMRDRLGILPLASPSNIPIQPLRLVAKWNPNQRQIRKNNRRAFAAGNRKAFA